MDVLRSLSQQVVERKQQIGALLNGKVDRLGEHRVQFNEGECYVSAWSDYGIDNREEEIKEQYNAWLNLLEEVGITETVRSLVDCRIRRGMIWYTFLVVIPEANLDTILSAQR
jgi:hypothetical protein